MKDLKLLALLSVLAFGLLTVSISKAETKAQQRLTELKNCEEIKFLKDGTGYTLSPEGKILMVKKDDLPGFCRDQASAKGLIPKAQ